MKTYMLHYLKEFLKAVMGGVFIAIGGTVYLMCYAEHRILGTVLFSIGLFGILNFDMSLYTGKVGYVFQKDKEFALNLIPVWFGNLAGTMLVAGLLHLTRFANVLQITAMGLVYTKLSDSVLSIFILAIFCNMLVFMAVHGFKTLSTAIGRFLALFLGVIVFILCGFEHCVADMFYFTVAGSFTWKTLLYLMIITLGNSIGALILPNVMEFLKKD